MAPSTTAAVAVTTRDGDDSDVNEIGNADWIGLELAPLKSTKEGEFDVERSKTRMKGGKRDNWQDNVKLSGLMVTMVMARRNFERTSQWIGMEPGTGDKEGCLHSQKEKET